VKRTLIAVFAFAAIICSIYASAAMSCSITDASSCADTIVLRMSNLAEGGSHAGLPDSSIYPTVVCCSGVSGLGISTTDGEEIGVLSSNDDAHYSKTGAGTTIYLTASSAVTCMYGTDTCLSGNTCLFSFSAEEDAEDAHVSGCEADEFPFSERRLCCRAGGGCSIDAIYWGVFDEAGDITPLAGEGPVGIAEGVVVFLIAETSGCRGASAEFNIYSGPSYTDPAFSPSTSLHGDPILMGNYKLGKTVGDGEELCFEDAESREICYEDMVLATWASPGAKEEGGEPETGYYEFELKLTHEDPEYTRESGLSDKVEVSNECTAIDPMEHCTSLTEDEKDKCKDECVLGDDGDLCPDSDCDGVANCIDRFTGTVADPELVDKCSGTAYGTAGCIPAIDCIDLKWSECKNCEAGEDCQTEGGFNPGDEYMERCEKSSLCVCKWADGTAPPGCTDAVLNQWENRFKACIEEEEFPVFTGFNIIAVLAILSIYYAVIIIRTKKKY